MVYGTLKILVSAPGPLGLIGVLNWVGLGWAFKGVLGQGLTILYITKNDYAFIYFSASQNIKIP